MSAVGYRANPTSADPSDDDNGLPWSPADGMALDAAIAETNAAMVERDDARAAA